MNLQFQTTSSRHVFGSGTFSAFATELIVPFYKWFYKLMIGKLINPVKVLVLPIPCKAEMVCCAKLFQLTFLINFISKR